MTIIPLVTYNERKLTYCFSSATPTCSRNPPWFITILLCCRHICTAIHRCPPRTKKTADYSWNNPHRRLTQPHGPCLLSHPAIWISNYISANLRYAMAILSYDSSICSITSSHHWFGGHRLVNYNLHYNIIARSIISSLRDQLYLHTQLRHTRSWDRFYS